jgi:tetratricopeptide (TPR) repeat protein
MMRQAWAVVLAGALALGAGAAARAQVLEGCANPDLAPRETRELCQRALRDTSLAPGQRAAVLVNLGVAQAALGQHADAETSFGLAIQTDPELVQAYGNRARSRLALGKYAAAMEDFDEAIARAPADAGLWLSRGSAQLRAGAARAAETDLTRAIGLDRGLDAAYFNRGIARLLLGQTAAAEEDFTTVIGRNPDDAGAFLNRARARAERAPAQAEADFDRAIELDPEWGRAWAARGLFLEDRGRIEEAERDFLRAYELGEAERWLVERVQRIGGG